MEKLFGTDGIRGRVGEYPLTQDMVYKIARAAAIYVKKNNPHKRKSLKISIAKDTRTSGGFFEKELVRGITSAGIGVVKLGVLPTPSCAYLVKRLNHDLGIVISASHNDIKDNGLKFFTHKGYKLSAKEEDDITAMALSEEAAEGLSEKNGAQVMAAVREEPCAVSHYIDLLRSIVDGCDISKYKIAVDCAFGAISYLMPKVAEGLGINLTAINNTPDGSNINKESGSLFPGIVSEAVIKDGRDCGFAFDGDADRVIACDEKGKILDGDHILAIIAKYLNAKGGLNKNSVVATMMSNIGLEMSVNQWGGKVIKTDVGDKHVLDKMLRSKLNLGGEQSGHIILLDHSTTGDGLLTALYLLKIMHEESKPLSALSMCMYKFPQILLNLKVKEKRPFSDMPKLDKAVSRCEAKLGAKGRLYIRYSGTENKLRIMVEGQDKIQIKGLAEDVAAVAREELC